MKCVKISGSDDLADKFISTFSNALPNKIVCVVSDSEDGGFEVSFPGSMSVMSMMRSMPPDIFLVRTGMNMIAPVVICGNGAVSDDSLLLARYEGEESSISPDDIFAKTFNLLPQKSAEECGRCGLDCRRFAEALLKGDRREEDCFYAPGSVEVKLGGRIVELGSFPAGMIEGAVRGIVSSLKGYKEEEDISVVIKS
ncbi:MAG: (Fe-S)-binding protein [Candidatus Fermentibacteria bacterium]